MPHAPSWYNSGRSLIYSFFMNLDPVCIFADPRDVSLFDVVAMSTGDAKNEFVEGGSAEDVDVVT